MRQIGCPETAVRNYHYTLRNSPAESSSQLLRGGSLKSHIVLLLIKFQLNSLICCCIFPVYTVYNPCTFRLISNHLQEDKYTAIYVKCGITLQIVIHAFVCTKHGAVKYRQL
jgi:hypothetical protein